jgi:hypothetical protein
MTHTSRAGTALAKPFAAKHGANVAATASNARCGLIEPYEHPRLFPNLQDEASDRFITNKPNQATPTLSQVALEPMIINPKILCFSEPR